MELIGINVDSSGLYKMYRDGDVLVTWHGSDEENLEEIARQTLIPDMNFEAASEDDWAAYGIDGRTCEIHSDEFEHARIDGNIYQLVLSSKGSIV
jgi:hypothetical protein